MTDSTALAERVKLLQEEVAALINEETGHTLFVLTIVVFFHELGHFLVARAQETGLATDLDAARPWLSLAVTALAGAEGARASALVRTVAGDMFVLAAVGMTIDDLDASIGLLHRTLAGPGDEKPDTLKR